jgi:hypothetical protein
MRLASHRPCRLEPEHPTFQTAHPDWWESGAIGVREEIYKHWNQHNFLCMARTLLITAFFVPIPRVAFSCTGSINQSNRLSNKSDKKKVLWSIPNCPKSHHPQWGCSYCPRCPGTNRVRRSALAFGRIEELSTAVLGLWGLDALETECPRDPKGIKIWRIW